MSEPTHELGSEEKEELRNEWENTFRRMNKPIDEALRAIINGFVSSGTRPSDVFRSTDAESGGDDRSTARRPEQHVDREDDPEDINSPSYKKYKERVAEREEEAKELVRELNIKDNPPPPGELMDLRAPDFNWEKYGWDDAGKDQIATILRDKWQFQDEQVDRAFEAFLLNSYRPQEIADSLAAFNPREQHPLQYFERAFGMKKSFMRTIFNDEMKDGTDFQSDPDSIEGLAWQLSWGGSAEPGTWGMDGKFPLFETRAREFTDENGQKRLQGKYYVNESNFLLWFRTEIEDLYDINGPNTAVQFMHKIKIEKPPYGGALDLDRMLERRGKMFTSEDQKTKYLNLWLQLFWEVNDFQSLYEMDIHYRQAMADENMFVEEYKKMMYMNPLTKVGFRTNMIQKLASESLRYKEGRTGMDSGETVGDNKLGAAWVEMVLAYYNLGDFTALQDVLGKDSKFFTRDGIEDAMKEIREEYAKKFVFTDTILPEKKQAEFDAAFGADGKVKDPKEFIKFINLFTTNLPPAYLELVIRRAITRSVEKKYGFTHEKHHYKRGEKQVHVGDHVSLGISEAKAWFFNRLMGGGARNDTVASVHDAMSKISNMDMNRRKYAKGEGKAYGNEQTIGKHLAAAVIPMLGIVTEQEVDVLDHYGAPVEDKEKGGVKKRYKSILEVLQDFHKVRTYQQKELDKLNFEIDYGFDEGAKASAEKELARKEKIYNKVYQSLMKQLHINENAQREYTLVHLEPGLKWMKRVMSGEGFDFKEYMEFDAMGGVRFKRTDFIKKVQGELIGTVRDMWKKYDRVNFNADIRAPFYNPATGKYEFRDCKQGMTVFGYDVLNRKELAKTDEHGNPMYTSMWMNGKKEKLYDIDFNKVNEKRLLVAKQVIMTEIAADMYRHMLQDSTDVRYKHVYYVNAINALSEGILGKYEIDELAKHGIKATGKFFDEADIAWLKDRALNGQVLFWDLGSFGFHLKWFLSSFWSKEDKEGLGLGKMAGIIVSESLKVAG